MIHKPTVKTKKAIYVATVVILAVILIAGAVVLINKKSDKDSKQATAPKVIPKCTQVPTDIVNLSKTDKAKALEQYKQINDTCTVKEQYQADTYEQKKAQFDTNYSLASQAFNSGDKATAKKAAQSASISFSSMSEEERTQQNAGAQLLDLAQLGNSDE